MADAERSAQASAKVFAVYFCAEDKAAYAGEGAAVQAQYKKEHPNKDMELTAFDRGAVPMELMKAGIQIYAKVVNTSANAGIFKKYSAAPNSLFLIAPNGEKLNSWSGGMLNEMDLKKYFSIEFKSAFEAWNKRQKTGTQQASSAK